MSNTQRPSLQKKHTRKTEEARQAGLDAGLRIVIGDEPYEVRLGDISPSLARDVRREFQMGPQKFLATMAADPDVDLLAGFMWIARRIRGEYVDLETVMDSVGYQTLLDNDIEFDSTGPEEVGELPPEG